MDDPKFANPSFHEQLTWWLALLNGAALIIIGSLYLANTSMDSAILPGS